MAIVFTLVPTRCIMTGWKESSPLFTHMAFINYSSHLPSSCQLYSGNRWISQKRVAITKRRRNLQTKVYQWPEIREVLNVNKDILALCPEARYSLVGTTAALPEFLGKMAKLLEVPFDNSAFFLSKPAEYEYFGKGDCVDLSTLEDTYWRNRILSHQAILGNRGVVHLSQECRSCSASCKD